MTHELQRPFVHAALTRRQLLGGLATATAIPALLSACGDSDESVQETSDASVQYTLVTRFPGNVLTPGEVRLPYQLSLGAANIVSDGPDVLEAQLRDDADVPIGDTISATKRAVDPFPYYDFRVQIDEPGIYSLLVDNGPPGGAFIQILAAEDVPVPSAGMALPGFDTPTFDDEQGFDTICTRTPEPCPFHDVTLTEALAAGRPVAYYVGTPAFCSTGSCGPALDSLITAADEFGDQITFVHAEVYADTAGSIVADAVGAVGMFYEPALFVTDGAGIIRERLDAIWGVDEVTEALRRAVA